MSAHTHTPETQTTGLPVGSTVCFLFKEDEHVTIVGVRSPGRHPELYLKQEGDPAYRPVATGFEENEELIEAVAPFGVPWIVCLLRTPKGERLVCRLVATSNEPVESLYEPPGSEWRVASLVGPSNRPGTFICVVSRLRPDGLTPPRSIAVEYAVARAGRQAEDFELLANKAERFRVG